MTTTSSPKTIALLGGTGRVGGWVLESCLEQGYHVRALCRSATKLSDLVEKYSGDGGGDGDGGKLVVVEGDATKEASIRDLLTKEVQVIISTLGSPSKTTLIVEESAKALTSALKDTTKPDEIPRIIWMTSTGINEATEQAMMYPMFGQPSKWFFGYGVFGWLQFKLLIPYLIGQDLWDDMAKSELVLRESSSFHAKTVLVRPTNMHPVSEHVVFSEEWRKEGGTNTKYQVVQASDPPPGKWMVRRAISSCIMDLILETKYDGTAISIFQDGTVE